jgi:processive 1,2-diacylglycerol beta-glucosyltransferase
MKILVIYATAGSGHKKAAEAIYNRIKATTSNEVSIVDALDYTNPFFKFSYSRGYTFLITHLPNLWGFFYWLTNNTFLSIFISSVCNFLNSRKLSKFLLEQSPKIVISTHFFANQVVSRLKKSSRFNCKLICTITDFTVHSFWLAKGVDLFTVATQESKDFLLSRGIPQDKIIISGIPVKQEFLQQYDRPELCKRFNLKPEIFTALIVTGEIAIGPIEEIIQVLKDEAQLIVVCGKNKKLFNKLNEQRRDSLKIFGLVDNMHELMSLSDIIITKAGGLTISESLTKRLPMIFFNLIPGQENLNAELMQSEKAGIIAKDVKHIKEIVLKLKANPKELETLKEKIKSIARPNAVDDILRLLK